MNQPLFTPNVMEGLSTFAATIVVKSFFPRLPAQILRKNRVAAVNKNISHVVFGGLFAALLMGCANSRTYPGPNHGLSFDGTIQSIDLIAHQFTVAPLKASAPVVFEWESTTKFWQNDLPIHADAVEMGRNVRVHYHHESGRLVAHHVYVRVPYAHE